MPASPQAVAPVGEMPERSEDEGDEPRAPAEDSKPDVLSSTDMRGKSSIATIIIFTILATVVVIVGIVAAQTFPSKVGEFTTGLNDLAQLAAAVPSRLQIVAQQVWSKYV